VLLTRFPDQVPTGLPDTVRHFEYLPFSTFLPRAGALIHFGGIGTASQGLLAGIPQLVVPLKNDQHDNARRLEDLGVARVLPARSFRAAKAVRALQDLLTSEFVAWRCRTLADRLRGTDPLADACRLIEELDPAAATSDNRPEGAVRCCG
jgi:UDP:flavonoid glycosyltransferase YjiC (YdhE family)